MFQFVHVYNLWTVSETACSYCSHLPFSLCSSWVIAVIIIFMQMCWFIPNCTQNQVITYTNSIEEVFNEQLHFFCLKAISSKNVEINTMSRTACSYENSTFSQISSNCIWRSPRLTDGSSRRYQRLGHDWHFEALFEKKGSHFFPNNKTRSSTCLWSELSGQWMTLLIFILVPTIPSTVRVIPLHVTVQYR